MRGKNKTEYVKFRSIRLAIHRHATGWRCTYPDSSVKSGWRYITRQTKEEIKTAAYNKAVEIANGTLDLSNISDDQAKLARAFLDLKPTWEDIKMLKNLREQENIPVGSCLESFIDEKIKASGRTKHITTLETYIGRLVEYCDNQSINSIKSELIQDWLDNLEEQNDYQPKTIKLHRNSVVSLWNWCVKQDIITVKGSHNEAQKTSVPEPQYTGIVETFTPEQLCFLFDNVKKEYLPWLAIVAFSGLRAGEISSKNKEPMTWGAIKMDQKVIICPAHLSKNKKRKAVPILPNLYKWLEFIKHGKPDQPITRIPANEKETKRLGELLADEFKIEGWPRNALRHSYGSYRVAITKNIGEVAIEMDNSESIIKKHYLESKSPHEAKQYFSITPSNYKLFLKT